MFRIEKDIQADSWYIHYGKYRFGVEYNTQDEARESLKDITRVLYEDERTRQSTD